MTNLLTFTGTPNRFVCGECGGTNFLEGPHGGLAVNFCCADCWARYNDSIISIDRHGWVEDNERECFRKTQWFPIEREGRTPHVMRSRENKYVIRIVVTAGIITDVPVPEYTKKWELLRTDWDSPQRGEMVTTISNESFQYAKSLQNPQRVQWVRVEWLWLR